MRVTEVAIRRLFTKQQLDEIFEESIYRYIQFSDDSKTPEETQKLHPKTDQTLLLSKRSEVDGSKAQFSDRCDIDIFADKNSANITGQKINNASASDLDQIEPSKLSLEIETIQVSKATHVLPSIFKPQDLEISAREREFKEIIGQDQSQDCIEVKVKESNKLEVQDL